MGFDAQLAQTGVRKSPGAVSNMGCAPGDVGLEMSKNNYLSDFPGNV